NCVDVRMESNDKEPPLILFSKDLLSYGRFQHAKEEIWSPSLD
ncbi:12769_t:CDS:2, partial [Funneliformis geosporum]